MKKTQPTLWEIVREEITRRQKAGENMSQLARICGVSRGTIYKYLPKADGQISDVAPDNPTNDTVLKLAHHLDIPDLEVYKGIMKSPERAVKMHAAEVEDEHLMDDVLELILMGKDSPEVRKLRSDVAFILNKSK